MSKRKRRRSHPMNVPNHAPDPYAHYKKHDDAVTDLQTSLPAESPDTESPQTQPSQTAPKTDDAHNPIFESKLLNVWQAPVTLRIPRGMIVICLLCITALVMLGYKAGEIAGKRQWQKLLSQTDSDLQNSLLPLNLSENASLSPSDAGSTSTPQSTSVQVKNTASQSELKVIQEKKIGKLQWLEGRVDPRQKDMKYFVLIHAHKKYAEKVVRFLGQEGVESAAIKRDNARLFKVVLLEGFSPDEEKSRTDYYLDLRSRIRQLGRRWKSKMGGATAWEDFFAQKFDGKTEATVIRTRKKQ